MVNESFNSVPRSRWLPLLVAGLAAMHFLVLAKDEAAADGMGAVGTGSTLAAVKDRGELNCQVGTPMRGFYYQDDEQRWHGFDVDVCRAVAAAVLGDANKVRFQSVTSSTRFASLNEEVSDLLSRTTTWTLERDTRKKVDFPAITLYDTQRFMVPVVGASEKAGDFNARLKGKRVCVQKGTTTLRNLEDYSRREKLDLVVVPFEDTEARDGAYLSGECDAITNDRSALSATLAEFAPDIRSAHEILGTSISREPLGPAVREGDSRWSDIVRWTVYAMIAAEQHGVTSKNVVDEVNNPRNAEVARLLGVEGDLHVGLDLTKRWAYNVIAQVGNYGEMYERHLGGRGARTIPFPRANTANELWNEAGNGGLIFSPPFR